MKKVASLRYEVIFKKAFTDIEIFKAFVKDFTGLELDIDLVETDKRFDILVGQTRSRYALFAQDKQSRTIVDIQHVHYFEGYKRFLYNHCAAILEQQCSVEPYTSRLQVFTIVVITSDDKHQTDMAEVDFDPKDLAGQPLNEIRHKILYLCPKYVTDDTPEPYRQWLRAINDSLDEEVDETAYQRPEIQKIFDLIQADLTTPQELFEIIDENGYEALGREYFEEGFKHGTAKALLNRGFDVATVMEATGLTEETVQQLAQEDDL